MPATHPGVVLILRDRPQGPCKLESVPHKIRVADRFGWPPAFSVMLSHNSLVFHND